MRSLKSGPEPVLTTSDRWSTFSTAPKDSKSTEDEVFSPMPDIFQKVVAAIVASSDKLNDDHRTVDFLQKPSQAPISIVAHNDSRPDGYLVLKNRVFKEGTEGRTFWADIVLPCEYKRREGGEEMDDDVRKCVWSLQHIMRDDARRRAVFGMTIENSTTRMWFCCRSSVVVSEPFDFIDEPQNLIKLFAAFAFADQESLGFDPTIQPVTGNRGQFVITIHPHDDKENPRRFKTTQILSSYGAQPLRGRGTRVFRAIEIDGEGKEIAQSAVLKDNWINSGLAREGDILASLLAEADDEDKELLEKYLLTTVCHGDVRTGLDDTANALMRGLNIRPNQDSLFKLQQKLYLKRQRTTAEDRSEGFQAISCAQAPLSHVGYAHKSHYRIVFEEEGTTIDRVKSLPEVMAVLSETTSALRLLRKLGWVHRDVSPGNILSYKGHAKLADLEYAKKMGDPKHHGTRTGTMHFMSVEVAAQQFLFIPPKKVLDMSDVLSLDIFGGGAKDVGMGLTKVPFSHNHLHDLESLWWVAVWVVFHSYFSKKSSPRDSPSFTIKDLEQQLKAARILFPPVFNSGYRRDGFQTDKSFRDTCDRLPDNKKAYCSSLDVLRQFIIQHYRVVEAGYPLSVDTNSSNDEIYDVFTHIFSQLQTVSHDLELDSISGLYEKMLKEKKPKNDKADRVVDQ